MRLSEALELTAPATLRRMAVELGVRHDEATTRDELLGRLAEHLSDTSFVADQLEALAADERAVLREARAGGGEVRGLLTEREHPGAIDVLLQRGLLYRVFAADGPLRGEVFVVPDEILALLPAPAESVGPPTVDPPAPSDRRSSDPTFSLFCLASALERADGALEGEVRPWSEEPGGWPWEVRWTFLRHVARAAGLLQPRADGQLAAGPTLERQLSAPARAVDRLRRAYLRDSTWRELHELPLAAFDPDGDGADLADTVRLRAAIVEGLEQIPIGAWVELEAFGEFLRTTRPTIVRAQLTPRGVLLAEALPWARFEAPLVRAFVLGPLYWLGIVGASVDGRRVVRRAPPPTSAAEPCVWLGPAELSAPPRADLGVLLAAERYLVLLERGRPSRYHLVQAHVGAALGSGGALEECRGLLRRLTQAELPAGVGERLDAWMTRFGALTMRPAVLLEARTSAELDAALAAPRVAAVLRGRLGPTAAEVAAADALEVAAALREHGELPRVDAALRLSADPRRAYAGLVDEQVLEFLLVSLLAFQRARPESLARLEGSSVLLERLLRQFPRARVQELRAAAQSLAGDLTSAPARPPTRRGRTRRRSP